MDSFKEGVKEAPAPHAAPPGTALLPGGQGWEQAGQLHVLEWGDSRGVPALQTAHCPLACYNLWGPCCLVLSVNPHSTDRDTRAIILGHAEEGTLSPPRPGPSRAAPCLRAARARAGLGKQPARPRHPPGAPARPQPRE